ncbi:arginine--tRNA ligase [Lysinibacillus sp. SGAir0095]|uniref:arginine--tRNA ligase n=1 Tax=Lysinibacillus sp. SGAir0095 TaxID=2070463 RepID=UPI0010CCC044|nr:arginine--tRNA ligase [Lysinibacillus sp. SGAir0095]QCR34274.1 arginine--tRNA ligase [Lysinibacillus sp. SGAir0095]
MTVKTKFAEIISIALEESYSAREIESLLETPKHSELGDLAFPCFTLAKKFKKSPALIAKEVAEKIHGDFIKEVRVENGYINVFFNQLQFAKEVMRKVITEKDQYGAKPKNGQTVVLDFSSPNIAKPFSMGHLRSTVIGNALANISEKQGYDAIRINHLGDWGTQFGKLIVAYRLWGNKAAIEQNPIEELLKIYVRFHDEAEHNEALNEQARHAFKELEEGNPGAMDLWEWFRSASLKEFEQIYHMLGVSFDSFHGEAFYNHKMQPVVDELTQNGLLKESDGAMVVQLENMPPCLITKKDGATLYATRDLAAAIYRHKVYQPAKLLYIVGNEQSLHFKQLFAVLKKMGYEFADNCEHIPFGMMLKDGKKMSTRKGKVVLLADVLKETIKAAKKNIEEKNPDLPNKETVANEVGIGAVIFNDLKNDRMNDIEFSIEKMVTFEGETGPYIQYTNARIQTLLTKGKFTLSDGNLNYLDEEAWEIIKLIESFQTVIETAFTQSSPAIIAKYSLSLARSFNKYYANTKFLTNDSLEKKRLIVAYAVSIILEESLRLLGIKAPKEM